MDAADWTTLLAAVLAAWLAYRLERGLQVLREKKLNRALRSSLHAEIVYNGELANTYLNEGILAPAYRFERTVFDATFSQLLAGGQLRFGDVASLLGFYSQVRQVNWCMEFDKRWRRI